MTIQEAIEKALGILQERISDLRSIDVRILGDASVRCTLDNAQFRALFAGKQVTLDPGASGSYYDAFGEIEGIRFQTYMLEAIAPPPRPPVKTITLPAVEEVAEV